MAAVAMEVSQIDTEKSWETGYLLAPGGKASVPTCTAMVGVLRRAKAEKPRSHLVFTRAPKGGLGFC